MEEPRQEWVRVNGIDLCFFEWGRPEHSPGPTYLMAHATGFHARCWDAVIRRMGEVHVIALDQRGHGRSEKTEIRHWGDFGRDLAALVRRLELRDVLGVGHSMGGHAMVDAAAACPRHFRRLVLIDPVIAGPNEYGGNAGGWMVSSLGENPHPTAKRKRHFDSPEAMIERFRERDPFRIFEPEALEDYCRFGLLPDEAGQGFVLACPPRTEADIYMTSRSNEGVHDSIAALELPVLVLRARPPPKDRDVMDFSSSPTWPGLASAFRFRNGREIHLPEHTHFLPMEIPQRVAEWILEEAKR